MFCHISSDLQFNPNQMRPLHLPHVAADAEFSNLPVLGWALSGLGYSAPRVKFLWGSFFDCIED